MYTGMSSIFIYGFIIICLLLHREKPIVIYPCKHGSVYCELLNKVMPREETQFKPQGVGLNWKIPPIAVRYTLEIDRILRAMPDRQDFIRKAVIEKLERENLLGEKKDG
jgi:hypothetical protein